MKKFSYFRHTNCIVFAIGVILSGRISKVYIRWAYQRSHILLETKKGNILHYYALRRYWFSPLITFGAAEMFKPRLLRRARYTVIKLGW
jgi:hypothetical protein